MLHRAYSLIEVKEITEEREFYVIRGMASTPSPDRYQDIVEPQGATFADTIPLLWQHESDKPVGIAELGKATSKGIPFTARLPIIKEAGLLKDRVDEAIQSIRYRLIAAVSIGFRVLNEAVETLKSGGLRFLETEILELSLVTVPANREATIQTVKAIDSKARATSGVKRAAAVRLISSPGETGAKRAGRGAVRLTPSKEPK